MESINLTIKEIVDATKGIFYGQKSLLNEYINKVESNSKNVVNGDLFVPIKGIHFDGHNFILESFDNGAIVSLSEKKIDKNIPYILVESTINALQNIAKYYRSKLSLKVIAVTGSVGKTSTKEFIYTVLKNKFNVLKTEGNNNSLIGLPITLLNIRDSHDIAVVEVGVSKCGEMDILGDILKPDIIVITNIGDAHLEEFCDRKGVYKEKSKIFKYISKKGIIILNGDDGILSQIDKIRDCNIFKYGYNKKNIAHITDIKQIDVNGSKGTFCIGSQEIDFDLKVQGKYFIYNMLASSLVGISLGLSLEEIVDEFLNINILSGHSNIIKTSEYTIIDGSYNANPESMKANIETLELCTNRKIAILGDMGELGNYSDALHLNIGMFIVNKNIDILICIGKFAKKIYFGCIEELKNKTKKTTLNISNIYYFENKEIFLLNAHKILKKDDVILVKASNMMDFNKIIKALSY